jgi:hypothetical protein
MAANVKWSSPQYSDLTYGSGSYGSPIQWRDGRADVRIIVFNGISLASQMASRTALIILSPIGLALA